MPETVIQQAQAARTKGTGPQDLQGADSYASRENPVYRCEGDAIICAMEIAWDTLTEDPVQSSVQAHREGDPVYDALSHGS